MLCKGEVSMAAETDFLEDVPSPEHVTEYDKQHLPLYLLLLDADASKADWKEATRLIFGIDPDASPERARKMHASHLARARWMTTTGHHELAKMGAEQAKME